MSDKESSQHKGSESPKKKGRFLAKASEDSDTEEGELKSDNSSNGSPEKELYFLAKPRPGSDMRLSDKDSSRDKGSKGSPKKKAAKRRFPSSGSDTDNGRAKYGRKTDGRGYGRPASGSRRGGARDTSLPAAYRESSPPYSGGPSRSGGGATTSGAVPGSSTGAGYTNQPTLPSNEMMDTLSKEVFRLNCVRGISDTNLIADIRIPVDMEQMEVVFDPNDFYYSGDGYPYRVRVPATMLFDVRPHTDANALTRDEYIEQLRSHFVERYRRQSGFHLFIDGRLRKLSWISTFWWNATKGDQREYRVEGWPKRVHAIYPHLRVSHSQGNIQLVMGLVFPNQTQFRNTRTQGRLAQRQDQTFISHDLRESYLDRSHPRLNFSTVQEAWVVHAFYVCRGARLLIADGVFSPAQQDGVQHHCRSLYQQGSLVVIHNGCQPEHCIQTEGMTNSFGWEGFYREYLVPHYDKEEFSAVEKQLDRNEYSRGRNLTNCNRRVYFLGAIESEHNSVCWEFQIGPGKKAGKVHHAHLRFPEGGYIEDITTWNVGWQLALARHRYERLYESVLEVPHWADWVIPDEADTQRPAVPAIPFAVPQDPDVLRRILGIKGARKAVLDIDYNAENMPKDYKNEGHERDRDIRRYLHLTGLKEAELYHDVDSVWFHNEDFWQIPRWKQFLPGPPLYPPIIIKYVQDDGTFKYKNRILSPYDKIVRTSPLSGRNLHRTEIEEMGFRVKDKTGQFISVEYEVEQIRTYGQPWKTIGHQYLEARIGRDYLGQRVAALPADQQPKGQALVLIDKGTKNTGWPWEGEEQPAKVEEVQPAQLSPAQESEDLDDADEVVDEVGEIPPDKDEDDGGLDDDWEVTDEV